MSEQSQNIKPKNRLQHLLAKIAGNDNAKTVKPKMKNEFYLNDIADEGGGGGGGANVLTLYLGLKDDTPWAYKNPECTEEYESAESASSALSAADVIKLIGAGEASGYTFFPIAYAGSAISDVAIQIIAPGAEPVSIYLFGG